MISMSKEQRLVYPWLLSYCLLCCKASGSEEEPDEFEEIHFSPYLSSNLPVNLLSLEGFAVMSLTGNIERNHKGNST